jgi:hypothetical protein
MMLNGGGVVGDAIASGTESLRAQHDRFRLRQQRRGQSKA